MKFFVYTLLFIGTFAALRIVCGLIFSNVQQLLTVSSTKSTIYRPLLSIVIPAYNEEKMILQCVMSVINQTYHNRQIIVINDGSSDDTLKILKSLEKNLIKSGQINSQFSPTLPLAKRFMIVNQTNAGKSSAINNALKNYASGELVTILDADSQLAPFACQKNGGTFL